MDAFLKRYVRYYGKSCLFKAFDEFQFGWNFTAMVIDKRDYSIQCLFLQDKSKESQLRSILSTRKSKDGRLKHEFIIYPTWGYDTVQLGRSPYSDQYRLSYSLSLHVSPPHTFEESSDAIPIIPVLDVNIHLDDSKCKIDNMFERAERRQHNAFNE